MLLPLTGFNPSNSSANLFRLVNGKLEVFTSLPGGQLDGMVEVGNDLVVSSWETQTLYKVNPQGNAEVLLKGIASPADLGYDSKRNRVLIPVLSENRP
ncbi:hypothetical protein GCM10008938_31670 [Deinococcus roseus]|uniref:Uncharacterized protein n=1 Tax=Deinococcus roseus TaxID=392414 RepID=A0ABQ2D2J1_9DEIO|nr:hypothetical protein GCM10008938_31670 [Deinococcus roseus]